MTQPKSPAFTPPTPQQLRAHLQSHPPTGPSQALAWVPALLIVVALVMSLLAQNHWAALLPLLLLGGVMWQRAWVVQGVRRTEEDVVRLHESALRRQYVETLRAGWRLLPRLTARPDLYDRTVNLIGHCLDRVGAYGSATIAFDHLLGRLPGDHPWSLQVRVQKALSLLGDERLADADDLLRRLRGPVDAAAGSPIAAAYRVAVLAQQVQTHHDREAIASAGDLLESLRPLGLDAAYGFALMALAHRRVADAEDDPGQRQQSAQWWNRATLLLPATELAARFHDLQAMLHEGPVAVAEQARTTGPA